MVKICLVGLIILTWLMSGCIDVVAPLQETMLDQDERIMSSGIILGEKNPWSSEEEGDHFPCTREWWNVDAFFGDGNKTWSVTASMGYEMETFTCNMFLTLFDGETGKCHRFGSFNDPIGTLLHKKNEVNLTYGLSTIQGLYPRYSIHLEDIGGIISLDMDFYAETLPHWVAENITNGFLPMGLGFYRYGFIPRCSMNGIMCFEGETFDITGSGYYEHVWGNWSYHDPLMTPRNVSGVYFSLMKWWLADHSFSCPSSITFSRDNNPFGYDWIWAIFDNNWSLFYGNIMFWIMKGPAVGVLYLEKDGQYIEFVDISYRYGAREYNEEYDIYYPLEIILEAKNDEATLSLCFTMTAERNAYIDRYQGITFWQGLGLWEAPGIVTGYYTDENCNISLTGKCEIEPQRLFSPLGHNELACTIYPETRGFSVNITSHLAGIKICIGFHFLPKPRFYLYVDVIEKESEIVPKTFLKN